MKTLGWFSVLLLALAVIACAPRLAGAAPEPCAAEIVAAVRATHQALRVQHPTARFLAFWDCDGTILKGDCSEGWSEAGRVVYAGLAQRCIEEGLAGRYPAAGGFEEFWRDYRYLDDRVGHWLAYPYLVQMLAGAPTVRVDEVARNHFERVLAPHVFATARVVLNALARDGVEHHILTASAERFVRGGADVLGVLAERIHGIRVREVSGRMTHELVYPVTYADGKRERLEEILAQERAATPGRPVFVLAAFGNSYATDGAFLAWVADQSLPAGRPVAVMFNGGAEREPHRGRFMLCELTATVGE